MRRAAPWGVVLALLTAPAAAAPPVFAPPLVPETDAATSTPGEAPPAEPPAPSPPPLDAPAAAPPVDWDLAHWPPAHAEVRGVVVETSAAGRALRFEVDNPHGVALRTEALTADTLTLRLEPARLAATPPTLPTEVPELARIDLHAEGDGVVATLRFAAPTAVAVDGNRLRALFGPAAQGLPLPPPGAEVLAPDLPSTAGRAPTPERARLDAALDRLSRDDLPGALAELLRLDASPDAGTRWLGLLWQGRLLRRLQLPLLALEPLAQAAVGSDDPVVRADAAAELLAVVEATPGLARLVATHLLPRAPEVRPAASELMGDAAPEAPTPTEVTPSAAPPSAGPAEWPTRWAELLLDPTATPTAVEARLALLAGRLAVGDGRRAEAATLFRLAARRGRLRAEAQWLAGLAAGTGPAPSDARPSPTEAAAQIAARAHFQVLLARADTDEEVKARAALALARLEFGAGALGSASAAYDRVPAEHPQRRAADLERRWIELRAAPQSARAALLPLLVPFDLRVHGDDHARLVATLYLGLCHPRRAEAIASKVLDQLGRDPIGERLADERARIEDLSAGGKGVIEALSARLTTYRARHEGTLPRTPNGRAQHAWLRLRISADAVLSAVLERRRQARFAQQTPEEPGGHGWSGTRFVPGEPFDPQRCATLELPDPLVGAGEETAGR